jgi:hypothetical protein
MPATLLMLLYVSLHLQPQAECWPPRSVVYMAMAGWLMHHHLAPTPT